ncbi:DUF262 domain-containing protein [bacterium]|nr:DUF262 domain-containing protein [bacterium]
MNNGPSTRIVKDIVADYRTGELTNPDYQREYVWSLKKATHFLRRTKKLGHVLGVITTYRLSGGTTNFLQDGRQRVTTLMRAIERPVDYGMAKEDVDAIRLAQVSQQSMVYESHDEARLDFQHLNDGVGLIPYEKYRGDLECDEHGRSLYELVRTKVDDLSTGIAGISRSSEHSRKKAGQLHRNSLGLFFQYATRHRDLQLYAKSERNLNDQIERRVRSWLNEHLDGWRAKVDGFIRTLERVNAVLRDKTKDHELRRWDMTAVRAMYAANVYCRNVGCTSDVFDALVAWFVASNANRKAWPARFEVDVSGTPTAMRLDQVSLRWIERVAAAGGPLALPMNRSKRIEAPAGYDESHVVPHADGGTETFVEPSIANRARGRNVID